MIQSLLNHLRRYGVQIWRDGESLRYRAPGAILTESLLEALRANKRGLIAALQAEERRSDPSPFPFYLSSALLGERIAVVCADWSRYCGESLPEELWPKDDAEIPVAYSLAELLALCELPPAHARMVHRVKRALGGAVQSILPLEKQQ
jgi:hypothetical protein